jgi:hypothetical protein
LGQSTILPRLISIFLPVKAAINTRATRPVMSATTVQTDDTTIMLNITRSFPAERSVLGRPILREESVKDFLCQTRTSDAALACHPVQVVEHS